VDNFKALSIYTALDSTGFLYSIGLDKLGFSTVQIAGIFYIPPCRSGAVCLKKRQFPTIVAT